MADKNDQPDMLDIFGDSGFEDQFFDTLDTEGMAISIVPTGLVIAFNREKILEMVDIVNGSKDDNVVLYIRRSDDGCLEVTDADILN